MNKFLKAIKYTKNDAKYVYRYQNFLFNKYVRSCNSSTKFMDV